MRIFDLPISSGIKGLSVDVSGTNMIYSGWKPPRAEITVPTTGLVNYFKFNEAAGSTTITESVTLATSSTIVGATLSTGYMGNAITFGSTAYVQIPNTLIKNLSTYSMFFWIYVSAYNRLGTGAPILFSRQRAGGPTWALSINQSWPNSQGTNGLLYFSAASAITNTPIPLNTWTHVGITVTTSTTVSTYINGVFNLSSSQNMAIDNITTSDMYAVFGNLNGFSWPATGISLDDFSLWNYAFTAAQVGALYNSQI
jgi:hypothetical protein